jgi:hypothetical protein
MIEHDIGRGDMDASQLALIRNGADMNEAALRAAYDAGVIKDDDLRAAVAALRVVAHAVEVGTALLEKRRATLN